MALGPQFEQMRLFDPGRQGNLPFRGRQRDPWEPVAERKLLPYGPEGDQLKMFMSPREIRSEWSHFLGDQYIDETTDELWDRKLAESKEPDSEYGSSLYQSIAEGGVKKPVHLGWDDNMPSEILGGHHRIASAMDIAPDDAIPVVHHNKTMPVKDD